jgi:hypothetical protein
MINKRAAKKQGSFLAALSHTRGGPDNFDNGLRDFLLWGGLVECSCPLTAITGVVNQSSRCCLHQQTIVPCPNQTRCVRHDLCLHYITLTSECHS